MFSKSIRTTFSILSLLFIVSCADSGPSFEVLDGEPAKLTTDERVQILNYWAVWCIPCIEELPELAEFNKKHHNDVAVYGINYDRPGIDELRAAVTDLNVEIPVLAQDPNDVLGYNRPEVLPTTIVMVAGEIKEVAVGPQDMDTLEALLNRWK